MGTLAREGLWVALFRHHTCKKVKECLVTLLEIYSGEKCKFTLKNKY